MPKSSSSKKPATTATTTSTPNRYEHIIFNSADTLSEQQQHFSLDTKWKDMTPTERSYRQAFAVPMLKKVARRTGNKKVTRKCMLQVNRALVYVAKRLASDARKYTQSAKRKTISLDDMKSAAARYQIDICGYVPKAKKRSSTSSEPKSDSGDAKKKRDEEKKKSKKTKAEKKKAKADKKHKKQSSEAQDEDEEMLEKQDPKNGKYINLL